MWNVKAGLSRYFFDKLWDYVYDQSGIFDGRHNGYEGFDYYNFRFFSDMEEKFSDYLYAVAKMYDININGYSKEAENNRKRAVGLALDLVDSDDKLARSYLKKAVSSLESNLDDVRRYIEKQCKFYGIKDVKGEYVKFIDDCHELRKAVDMLSELGFKVDIYKY